MKVILYMAITANGMVAREDGSTDFVSEVEWKSFSGKINKIGNIVIGRKTYEVMEEGNEFSKFNKVKVVVLSHEFFRSKFSNVVVKENPREAINFLRKEGFKEVLVAGGGKLNSSFMKEGLVDEIYLDIEPTVLGKGIKLFADEEFEAKLELLETKMLSKNEIQLHYKVKK